MATFAGITILLSGCIHTYPTPEEAIDPTEIDVTLSLHFADIWLDKLVEVPHRDTKNPSPNADDTGAEISRAENLPRRLYVELNGSDGMREQITRFITPEELTDGKYTLPLPFKLKAREYTIAAWTDYLHPGTLEPLAYDISTPYLVREILPRGTETDSRTALTAKGSCDLRHLAGKWGSTKEIEMTLTSPLCRVVLIADDYAAFMDYTKEARRKGEKYYIYVNYESDIPGAFSITDGEAMDPVSDVQFSSTLLLTNIPTQSMTIASDWLFNPPQAHSHTVTIKVLNTAKALVSQISGLTFPTEQGKITTVRGDFLTNFITGGIQIDNIWAGEIIIEID